MCIRDSSYNEVTSAGTKKLSFTQKTRFSYEKSNLNETKEFQHETITREQMGHMGWTLLHLMTGNYPVEPTIEDQQKMNEFLHLFGYFYPCKECSGHFLEMLKNKPVRASSREELMAYLCELHNEVNIRLNKSVFNCKLVQLQWGDCGCTCLLYTSPSPRDRQKSRMPSSA
eukprot:TRINITY_DN7542_c0_g2_i4.p1 TRINITY_DN7542_c0_g2~~TRINITY_DN7542_c0_g2_i4.p1  ORF type:complete len:171 (+),score=19.39 TRINITY_DN7542_c0_g2_i4:65-577(+)